MKIVAISTSGPPAVREAKDALQAGKHVALLGKGFTLAEEVELKREASKHGLLLLGPGCGTSIVDGEGFGIWNSVRQGPVGIVCTNGSGVQELSCLVDEVGVSHVFGVGPKDLSEKVGAIGTLSALRFLAADDETDVIVVAALAPSAGIIRKVLGGIRGTKKSVVVCFLGTKIKPARGVFFTRTLEDAAAHAISLAKGLKPKPVSFSKTREFQQVAEQEYSKFGYGQRYIRGLYSGGMLCAEAQVVLQELVGVIRSNAPLKPRLRLPDPRSSRGHACVDMGAPDLSGETHPAVELRPRCERILREAKDWEVGVVLLDVVLGHGAHPNPAKEIVRAVGEAKQIMEQSGGYLSVVASVVGTDLDPQNLSVQREVLEKAGVLVTRSNAQAAGMATLISIKGKAWKNP